MALDRQTLARLRWSGIAGSVGYMIGDALLLGNSATVTCLISSDHSLLENGAGRLVD